MCDFVPLHPFQVGICRRTTTVVIEIEFRLDLRQGGGRAERLLLAQRSRGHSGKFPADGGRKLTSKETPR